MSTRLHLFPILWCLLFSTIAFGQTTIGLQDFEAAPAAPAMGFVASNGSTSTGTGAFPTDNKFVSGSQGYQANNETAVLTFDAVNTTAFSAISLELRLASFAGSSGNGADGADEVEIEISTDGGTTWSSEFILNGDNNAKWSFTSGTASASFAYDGDNTPSSLAPGGGGYRTADGYSTVVISNLPSVVGLRARISMKNNSSNEFWVIDDVLIEGTPSVVCTHTVTTFTPTSGTPGSEIQIMGTGFTASTIVDFDGVPASSVRFVDATTIIATVPNGATTGLINVTEASCLESTAGNFTRLEGSGACISIGTIFSDLVISEVYDQTSGSLGYIEIYNGTGAAINLADYRIDRYGELYTVPISFTYTFPAMGVGSTIAPGQALVGRVSTTAGGAEDFDYIGTTSGFNDDDRLELVKISTGVLIDDFHDATVRARGYIYRRNTSITGPNPTYTASEWTNATAGDVSDLGTFINSTPTTPPTIATQPSDANGCNLDFTVNATAGNGGTLTYQWFFNENDGSATGWTAVSAAAFPATTVAGEASNNLTITGNLMAYDGYQFYVSVVEDGSCEVLSEAVQFSLAADRFFRSVQSGNWADATTWEMATSAAGPWSPTCVFPVADNSDYIHIMAGHTVTVAQNILADQTVIETGGTVSINNNSQLQINGGIGVDLEVLGTLIDNGIAGGRGINLSANGGTWLLGAAGTIIKTGSSTTAQYRDNYEGGIATIPATANWIYRHTTNSTTVSTISLNMFYPNLSFESINGGHAFSSLTEMFQGVSGITTVKGNLMIGASGTAGVQVFNVNTNATPMQVLGDLIIGGATTGTSILHNNNGGNIGTGIEVMGDLLIDANGQLDFDDGTAAADGRFTLHGDWLDFNTGSGFVAGQSTVALVGNTTQTMDKVSGSETMYNLIVNKSAGDVLNNIGDWTIANDVTFVNGIVRTAATSYLFFEAAATATGASNASHVDGPVMKETNIGSLTTFTYPTGDNGIYAAIGIETRFNLGEFYIAEYFNTPYSDLTVNPLELDHVSQLEYWTLDEFIGGSGEELRVTLHWGAHSQVLTLGSLHVAHYYTQAPSVVDIWESEGNIATTGNATMGTVTSNYVTTFSPFTLGDDIRQSSLPLDILAFTATKVAKTAELYWEVANEKATDKYCLQRSGDGQNFETLHCFEATQDNATASYNYTDQSPLLGDNYYRIHQVDYLGDDNYSTTRNLYFEGQTQTSVYPSPAQSVLTVELSETATTDYTLQVLDVLGQVVLTETLYQGNHLQVLNVRDLAAGTYLVRIIDQSSTIVTTEKIVIQN